MNRYVLFLIQIFTATLVSGVTLAADCPNGYDKLTTIDSATFSMPNNGVCQLDGYNLTNIPDVFSVIYNGLVVGNETTLCDNGYLTNDGCVSYVSGDCIAGYFDMGADSDTIAELTNGTCTNPYSTFTKTTRCDRNPGDTCVDLPTPVVALTWDDGMGNITTNTCIYEESVTLPPTPTRTGYVFNGWTVVNE